MRTIKGDSYWLYDSKDTPKGTCSLCGGIGRYKRTYKYKNPVITSCLVCRGTGKVEIKVTYNGSGGDALNERSKYDAISEGTDHYVIRRGEELIQMPKEWFEEI